MPNIKILSIGKSEKADVVKAKINNSFYEIVVDSTFCKSYLYYNEKDTILIIQLYYLLFKVRYFN